MLAPRRLVRSAAAVALAASATSLAYAGSAAPARAASAYNGYCTSSAGVTVVVDFGPLGGGLAIRCAPVGGGATGMDALRAAGIPVTMPVRTPGFVCRLYGQPTSSATLPGGYHEQCVNTPPSSAYWSYWKAPNGGSWSVSSQGVETSQVIPGGFEGWRFVEGSTLPPRAAATRPVTAPKPTSTTTAPAPPRHTTTTTTAPRRTTTSPHATRSTTHVSRPSSTVAVKPSGTHSSSHSGATRSHDPVKKSHHATASTASRSSTSSSSRGAVVAAGGPTVGDSDKLIKDANSSSGVNATTVVGGGVLAALAIGGAVVSIVRRRNLG
jgi:hypothetical protein